LIFWTDWADYFFWLIRWDTISDVTRLADFFNLYQHGQWWLLQYINPQTQFRPITSIGYLPTSFPFFGLFALFNFGFAAQLWIVICLSVFVVALFSLALTLESERRLLFISIAVLLFLTSYPLRIELELGQLNLLIASLTVLSLVAQRFKHNFVSALLLSIGTLLKGPPMLFLIYFVVFRRDLRYLINFLTCTIGIVAVSLFVIPIQWYLNWVMNIVPTYPVASGLSQSITGLVSLAGLNKLSSIIFLAGICLWVVFAFYINSDRFIGSGMNSLRADAMFLVNALIMLLIGPSSWFQNYVWVILPIALFLSRLIMEETKTTYLAIVGFATFLMNVTHYPTFAQYFYWTIPVFGLPTATIGVLVLTISLVPIFLCPNVAFHSIKIRAQKQIPLNGSL
jgi:hypothetical protein